MRRTQLILLGLLLALPAAAQGAVLMFGFEGVVDYVGYDPLAPVSIQLGDLMIFEYTFDTDAPRVAPGGGAGDFRCIDARIVVDAEEFPLTPDSQGSLAWFDIQNAPSDFLRIGVSISFDEPGNPRKGYGGINLTDPSGTALHQERPPQLPPDLSKFSEVAWGISIPAQAYDGTLFSLGGRLTRSYQVPEPAGAMLLGLSILTVFARRRRLS